MLVMWSKGWMKIIFLCYYLSLIMKLIKPFSVMLCSLSICSSCMEQRDIIDKRFTTIQEKCGNQTIRMDAEDLYGFSSDNGTYHCTAEIFKGSENSGQDSIWLIERSGKFYEGRFIDATGK